MVREGGEFTLPAFCPSAFNSIRIVALHFFFSFFFGLLICGFSVVVWRLFGLVSQYLTLSTELIDIYRLID